MKEIIIEANDSGQRLDRFLKKYLCNAPLSGVYKIIRKDVKVNGKRCREEYLLSEGDCLCLYMADSEIEALSRKRAAVRAKRQFSIVYEDENILIVSKPFGLLVHGDKTEKKDTLANQVTDYLIETGAYNPRLEKSFVPSPAHRLDRNTTGVVVFGKNAPSLRELARLFREDGLVSKYYYTIVHGELKEKQRLVGKILKDEELNIARVLPEDDDRGRYIETVVSPVACSGNRRYSLVEVELVTGRSHQIRAHLSSIGHPLVGDSKYGGRSYRSFDGSWQLGHTTQALHAFKIEFKQAGEPLAYLNGKSFTAPLPLAWGPMEQEFFGGEIVK